MNTNGKYNVVDLAASFAVMAGLVMLIVGLFRLGFLLNFISAPIVAGFTTGGAATIIVSQVSVFLL